MTLSEYERHLFEEILRELYGAEPMTAVTLQRPRSRKVLRLIVTAIQFVCGMGVVCAALEWFPLSTAPLLGLSTGGFLLAFDAAVAAVTGLHTVTFCKQRLNR